MILSHPTAVLAKTDQVKSVKANSTNHIALSPAVTIPPVRRHLEWNLKIVMVGLFLLWRRLA